MTTKPRAARASATAEEAEAAAWDSAAGTGEGETRKKGGEGRSAVQQICARALLRLSAKALVSLLPSHSPLACPPALL